MLPFKSHLIVGAVSLIIGLGAGYSIRDEKAHVKDLENIQSALELERDNLIKQLEVEHEYQKAAQATAEQAQADLESLEASYADAINELNNLQLFYSTQDYTDESALSDDSESAVSVPEEGSQSASDNEREFQKLYEEQLKIAKDCDITTSYYNRILALYESIQTQ